MGKHHYYLDIMEIFVVVEKDRANDFEIKITENSDRNATIMVNKSEYYA